MSAILDWLYDVPEMEKKSAELSAKHDELNRRNLERGKITEDDYNGMRSRVYDGQDFSGQMDEAFDQGWDQGYEDMTGGIKNTLNGAAGFVWNSIPWWVWLGGALYLLHITGFLNPLMGKLRKAIK